MGKRKVRANGEGTVYRDKKHGHWIGEIDLDGKTRRRTGKDKITAARRLREMIVAHQGGRAVLDGSLRLRDVTVQWRERELVNRPGANDRPRLTESTVAMYRWSLALIDAELGHVRLRGE